MPGAPKAKIEGKCTVCCEKSAQYRCPGCLIVYCSLTCYKTHKQTTQCLNIKKENNQGGNENLNPNPGASQKIDLPKKEPPILKLTEEEEERDRVKRSTLAELAQSEHLKKLLANKHLRDMLIEINESHNPDRKLEGAMQFPIFTEFVDECMSIVDKEPVGT